MRREPIGSRWQLRNDFPRFDAAEVNRTGTMVHNDQSIAEPAKLDTLDRSHRHLRRWASQGDNLPGTLTT